MKEEREKLTEDLAGHQSHRGQAARLVERFETFVLAIVEEQAAAFASQDSGQRYQMILNEWTNRTARAESNAAELNTFVSELNHIVHGVDPKDPPLSGGARRLLLETLRNWNASAVKVAVVCGTL